MAVIFFIFGVTLDTSELKAALKAWKAVLFGLSSILFLSPLFGFLAVRLPFKPPEFALGVAIMACVPTSLSSGVTLVIGGYGNGALALLFTVAGNIAGIVTAPLMVKAVLGSLTDAKVDSLDLLVKLGVSILVPVLAGKALREAVRPVRCARREVVVALARCGLARRIEGGRSSGRAGAGGLRQPPICMSPCLQNTPRHSPQCIHPQCANRDNVARVKAPLYLVNNLQITLIVWQKLSAAREVLVQQEAGDVLLAGLAAVVLHFALLVFNVVATWLARFPEAERKAIVVMAAQKNLPTAATVISYFDPAAVGNLGLITIPCIVFYIMQVRAWHGRFEI